MNIHGEAVMAEELIGDVELDKLLSEFSNAIFDCGEWDEDNDENYEPYGDVLNRATAARIAFVTAVRKRLATF